MHRFFSERMMLLSIVTAGLLAALIVIIDQVIKFVIYEGLYPEGRITVIDGLFSLIYTENRGAAFGMLQNGTILFSILTVVLVAVFIYLFVRKKFVGKLFASSVVLIVGGGIGNLIDRIFRGFVIDYLSVSFFPPICNFADYCITVGAALFIISILFIPENRKLLEDKKPTETEAAEEEISSEEDDTEDGEDA